MRVLVLLAATLLASSPCGAGAQSSVVGGLELHVSGGFLGPEFVVTLSEQGTLIVTRTDHATAPATWQKQLSRSEQREILQVAIRVKDFNSGCDREIPDGTNAVLRVHSSDQKLEHQVVLCGRWPSGPRTVDLLMAINRHLPSSLKVF
jgi:hypothetical protein